EPDWISEDCRHKVFLITQDPPDHRKLRNAISKSFEDATITALIPYMRSTAQNLREIIMKAGRAEFMTDFAFPYVGAMIGKLFGLNMEGLTIEELRRWVELIISNTPQRPEQSHIDAVEAATRKLFKYIEKNIQEHRGCPFTDGTADLLSARVNDKPFSDEELR